MRWIHLTIIILFAAAALLFALQNLAVVTVSFLRFSVQAPLAILTAIIYLLGAVTGGSLLAFLRRSVKASRAGWPARSQRPPT